MLAARVATETLVAAALCAVATAGVAAAVLAWGVAAEPLRVAALVLIAAAIAVPIVVGFVRLRREGTDAQLARGIERALPEFRTDIRAALELADAEPASSDTSMALRTALAARVAERLALRRDALDATLPARDLRGRAGLLLALVGAIAASAWVMPQGYGQGWVVLLLGAPERTDAGTPVNREPLISTVDFVVTPPAYTGLPPRFVPRSTGDIEVLAGSEIAMTAFALQSVTAARVVLEYDGAITPVPVDITGGRALSARFVATSSVPWRIELDLVEGGRAVDPVPRRVSVLPDQPPQIELTQPPHSLEVTPDQVIDFEYLARDDFGLTGVSLVWAFAEDEDNPHVVPLQGAVGAAFQEHVPFDLAPLALQPREEIVVAIEAHDNNGIAGASVGRSRAVSLRVAAPDDRHDDVLAQKQALFEMLLERLGSSLPSAVLSWEVAPERQRVEARGATLSPLDAASAVGAAIEAHAGWPPVLDAWQALIAAMETDGLTVQRDLEMLREGLRNVTDAERATARALDRAGVGVDARSVPQSAIDAVAPELSALIDRTERVALLLEDLVATHIADDIQRNLAELAAIRDDLRELLQQYADTQDPAVREQIERELRRLEARMRELIERLAAQMQNLPAEHLNLEGLDPSELGESLEQMGSSMDQIREMLDRGDIEGAMAALEQMAANLDAMAQELEQPLGGAQPDGLSEFDQRLAELMDQVNELELQQQDLEQATGELEQQMHAERQAEIAEQLERVLDGLHEQMRALRQDVEDVPRTRLGGETQRMLTESEASMRRAEQRLAERDIAGAREALEQAQQAASDTAWQLRRDESLMLRDETGAAEARQGRRAAEQGQQGMQAIDRQLEALQQLAQPRPGAAQQAQLSQLGQQQQGVSEQLGQLQQAMSEFGERFPLGESMNAPMEQAREGMGTSESSLQGGRPRPAMQGQQQALDGLRQMRRNLQQMAQQQRQSGQGRTNAQERVEIPEEGQSGRQAFRDDVVDAMREGTLDQYRDAVRRYYESLVQ